LLLIWSRSQGLSRKDYVSKPVVPEDRQANRLRDKVAKKKKDAAKEATARKRDRKEKHAKACQIAQLEGTPRLPMPESTEEEDSSGGELNFSESDDYKVVTGASPPSAHRGAGGEGTMVTLGEARLVSGSLVVVPAERMERRSPTPAVGQRSPMPAVRRRSPVRAAGRRSPTPATGQRLPSPGTGRRTPVPAVSTGGGGSAASADTPSRTASRPRANPRVHPWVSRREVSACRGPGGTARANAA
jgi:hypothetical protein